LRTNIFHKNYKTLIAILGLFLFGLGIFTFYSLIIKQGDVSNFMAYRFMRGVVCFTYLTIILLFQKKESNPLLITFLALYGTSSLLTIWYENNVLATLAMGLNVLAFSSLVRAIAPKVNIFKFDWFHILSFIIMMLFNGFLGYQFIIMFKEFTLSNLHFTFIVLNTLGIVFVSYLGILFNHKYSSKNTLMFSGFVFLLLFTEVFRGIAYYDMAYGDFSAHIARALLIISLSFLTHYTFLAKKDKELLNNRFL